MKWAAWSRRRTWLNGELEAGELEYALDHGIGVLVCITRIAYAECQGPSDPCCGLCKFSVHGCNDNGPSRAEYIFDVRRG